MRRSTVPAFVLACLSLTGCTSNSGPDALVAGLPSKEVTNSVTPSAPVPQASVGQTDQRVALNTKQHQEVLAWGGPMPAGSPAFAAVDKQMSTQQRP